MKRNIHQFALPVEILGVAVFVVLACFIRTRNLPFPDEASLIDTDSYRFYRQAQLIATTDGLPPKDMMRWSPIGRDLRQTPNGWPHLLVYSYWLLRTVLPSLTLYQVAVFSSVACFVLALLVLYLMVRQIYGPPTALLCLCLLSSFSQPDLLIRSSAGFADRDSFCLLLGFLSLYAYYRFIRASLRHSKILWCIQYTWITVLLGLTWEGAGLFIAVIVLVNLVWLLFYHYRWEDLCLYAGWYILFATCLLFLTHAYRGEANTHSPFALITLGAPLAFLLLATLSLSSRHIKSYRYRIAFGGCLSPETGNLIGMGSLWLLILTLMSWHSSKVQNSLNLLIMNLLSPLGNSRLMQSVSELEPSLLPLWVTDYKMMVPFLFIGFQMALYRLLKRLDMYPWLILCSSVLWMLSLFYLENWSRRFVKVDPFLLKIHLGTTGLFGLSFLVEHIRLSWRTDASRTKLTFKSESSQWMLLI